MWENVPTKLTEWRDRLLECATVQTILTGIATGAAQQSRFHYPFADPDSPKPYFILQQNRKTASRLGAGTYTNSGEVSAGARFDDSTTIGTMEGYADTIPNELCELVTEGLYIVEADSTRCGVPNQAEVAGGVQGQVDDGATASGFDVVARWEG